MTRLHTHSRHSAAARKLLTDAAGSLAVEYALLLAIVAGTLLSAVAVVGFAGRQPAPAAGSAAVPAEPVVSLYAVGWVQLGEAAVVLLLSGALWRRLRESGTEQTAMLQKEAARHEPLPQLELDATFEKRQEIFNILAHDMRALLDSRLEVAHLMSRHVAKVLPGIAADEVARLMREKRVRHLLVCNLDGRLVGVISDRDLTRTDAKTAEELMTRDPVTVEPDAPVSPAITLLIQRRISCLPVVDDQHRLCGVLTTTDLMMTLQCSMQMLQRIAHEVKPGKGAAAAKASTVCAS